MATAGGGGPGHRRVVSSSSSPCTSDRRCRSAGLLHSTTTSHRDDWLDGRPRVAASERTVAEAVSARDAWLREAEEIRLATLEDANRLDWRRALRPVLSRSRLPSGPRRTRPVAGSWLRSRCRCDDAGLCCSIGLRLSLIHI